MANKRAILVTGCRWWDNRECLYSTLREVPKGTLFIQGDATGADTMAKEFAISNGYGHVDVPYFKFLRRAGGPVRNAAMLDILRGLEAIGYTVGVYAFHTDIATSKGTANMIEQCQRAGIDVTLCDGVTQQLLAGRPRTPVTASLF